MVENNQSVLDLFDLGTSDAYCKYSDIVSGLAHRSDFPVVCLYQDMNSNTDGHLESNGNTFVSRVNGNSVRVVIIDSPALAAYVNNGLAYGPDVPVHVKGRDVVRNIVAFHHEMNHAHDSKIVKSDVRKALEAIVFRYNSGLYGMYKREDANGHVKFVLPHNECARKRYFGMRFEYEADLEALEKVPETLHIMFLDIEMEICKQVVAIIVKENVCRLKIDPECGHADAVQAYKDKVNADPSFMYDFDEEDMNDAYLKDDVVIRFLRGADDGPWGEIKDYLVNDVYCNGKHSNGRECLFAIGMLTLLEHPELYEEYPVLKEYKEYFDLDDVREGILADLVKWDDIHKRDFNYCKKYHSFAELAKRTFGFSSMSSEDELNHDAGIVDFPELLEK